MFETSNDQAVNTKGLDIIMVMYNLLEYNKKYSERWTVCDRFLII